MQVPGYSTPRYQFNLAIIREPVSTKDNRLEILKYVTIHSGSSAASRRIRKCNVTTNPPFSWLSIHIFTLNTFCWPSMNLLPKCIYMGRHMSTCNTVLHSYYHAARPSRNSAVRAIKYWLPVYIVNSWSSGQFIIDRADRAYITVEYKWVWLPAGLKQLKEGPRAKKAKKSPWCWAETQKAPRLRLHGACRTGWSPRSRGAAAAINPLNVNPDVNFGPGVLR